MKKDVLLLDFSFVTYMERKDHISLECKYTQFAEEAKEALAKLADKYDLKYENPTYGLYVVGGGLEPDNSGQCEVCNECVSAQNKENAIIGLGVGAEYNNRLYCQQHLPKESPMYKVLYPVWEREDESYPT